MATAVYLVNTRATGELRGGLATLHRKLSEGVEQVDFKSRNKYSGSHRTEILTVSVVFQAANSQFYFYARNMKT